MIALACVAVALMGFSAGWVAGFSYLSRKIDEQITLDIREEEEKLNSLEEKFNG